MDNLTSIARQAMIEHGLQPDFSPEAQRQAESLSTADSKTRSAIRDLPLHKNIIVFKGSAEV